MQRISEAGFAHVTRGASFVCQLPTVDFVGFRQESMEILHFIQNAGDFPVSLTALIPLHMNQSQGFTSGSSGKIHTTLNATMARARTIEAKGFMDDNLAITSQCKGFSGGSSITAIEK